MQAHSVQVLNNQTANTMVGQQISFNGI